MSNSASNPMSAEHVIAIGGKKYLFFNVPLTPSAIDGRRTLTYGSVRPLMLAVAKAIIAGDEGLLWDELTFLAKTTEVSLQEFMSYLSVEEDVVRSWRDEGRVPNADSVRIRTKMAAFLLVETMKKLPEYSLV